MRCNIMSMHKGILGQQFGGATVQQDQTLGDYIHRKRRAAAFDEVAQEKKMTFEEFMLKRTKNVNRIETNIKLYNGMDIDEQVKWW